MVKTVVGDEAQLKAAEDRLFQSGVSAEVGLVIGNLSANSDRGFVYYLIPTPPTDGGGPACSLKREVSGNFGKDGKKGSKGAKAASEAPASLVIDADWVAEHARQVSRMLLGGMSVAGIYLWASEASFKATSPVVLAQAVKGVAQAAPFHDSEFGERLLIHVSYSPRRWSCRICTVSTGSLHPCDFKMSKLIASLQAFKCTYNFDIRLPIYQDGTSRVTLKDIIYKGITNLSKDLQCAKFLINGHMVTEDLQLLSKSTHDVEFLVPFNKTMSSGDYNCGISSYKEFSSEEMAGLVSFNGSVVAFAYLAPREPFLQAISDLKCDITSTLRSRLEMIADEAEEGALSTNGGAEKSIHQLTLDELRKPCSLTFPRRVLVPWLDGLLICDYLQASETSEDIKDHCKEMMAMEAPIEVSTVVDLETTPSDMIARSFWHVAHEHLPSPSPSPSPAVECRKQHPTKAVQTARSQTSNFYFLLAILVLVSALVVGWAIGVFGPVNTPN
ncbi:protein odr-4 homolog isoform X1 [Zingiber officinale]|uniref:protein odr-4 homolog isoform X1 n=1 Tax=Zingiber officinale TaxID=94328 RepID=UPI001C4CA22C|nr:protein odr-4 homolog isoform X1 [Zingiber officinale]